MIAIVCLTAGRDDYLERTIASLEERVSGPIGSRLMFDDTGDLDHARQLQAAHPTFDVLCDGKRLGQAERTRAIFRTLLEQVEEPYVFWLEEDFTFNRDVDLLDMVELLEHPDVWQAQLLRQAWYPVELEAGGIIEREPRKYEFNCEPGREWVEHREWWTWNPSMFRREQIVSRTYPRGGDHERRFGESIIDADARARYAILGDGTPWITHIGEIKA